MSAAKISKIPSAEKNTQEEHQQFAQEILAKTQKDMGKVGLVISILAVILSAVLFFGLNQNVKGLSEEVSKLGQLSTELKVLSSQVGSLESKVAALENLPQKTKNLIIANTLQDMAQKTKYLSSQVQTEEQATKLLQAQELLKQVQVEIGSN
ncbi:MAG TPA: hypothetical protein DIT19_03550 [Desulfonauticus sp.]|jgi:outer membrane murein-binding lipoprotein Lpp|nr:hypothetical protein [Desulfonauticus sp.]HCO12284.1 hypothetical protein [Desulfonauticus sp.]